MRLYANKAFAAASVTMTALGAALFGAMVLMPLYFQLVRGEDAVHTGLLLAPQGIGAAFAMALSGRVTERFGGGLTSLIGGTITIVATIPFVLIEANTRFVLISAAMVVRGFGIGMSMMPSMTAAYAVLRPDQINDATPQLNVLQRVGGSIGTAILTVVLQSGISGLGHPDARGRRRRVRRHLLVGARHQPRRAPPDDRPDHDRAPRAQGVDRAGPGRGRAGGGRMTVAELDALRAAFGELMGAERRLRGRDPRHAQIRTLVLIAKDEEITAGTLAKRAELSPGAMTAMLDQLEEKGTISRRRSETDRRQVIVTLTEAGRETVAAKRKLWERHWHDGLAAHSEDELLAAAQVMRTIAGVLDGVGKDETS